MRKEIWSGGGGRHSKGVAPLWTYQSVTNTRLSHCCTTVKKPSATSDDGQSQHTGQCNCRRDACSQAKAGVLKWGWVDSGVVGGLGASPAGFLKPPDV